MSKITLTAGSYPHHAYSYDKYAKIEVDNYMSNSVNNMCNICKAPMLINDDGFYVCMNEMCGYIDEKVINTTPEWRYYGHDDDKGGSDPARCSFPADNEDLMPHYKFTNTQGMSYKFYKIKQYAQWELMSHKKKTQLFDLQYITNIATNNGILKKIIDDAFIYYKKIFETNVSFRGENRDSIIAASIYIAFCVNNCSRTAKEIAKLFNLDKTAATKGVKKALNIITLLEKDLNIIDKTQYNISTPVVYIERFCNNFVMPNDLVLLAEFICYKIEYNGLLCENTPQSIATGVIYFISNIFNLKISKKHIKDMLNISEVTINKCYKNFIKDKHNYLPSCLLNKYNISLSATLPG